MAGGAPLVEDAQALNVIDGVADREQEYPVLAEMVEQPLFRVGSNRRRNQLPTDVVHGNGDGRAPLHEH